MHFGRWLLPRGGYRVLYDGVTTKISAAEIPPSALWLGWLGGGGNLDVARRTVSSLDIYSGDVTDGGHCTPLHQ